MYNWIVNGIHIWLAGSWTIVWHWGMAVGIILLLLATFVATFFIPIVGNYLGKFREDLLIAAVIVGIMQALFVWGTHTGTARCKAQIVVVEKIVTKAVNKAQAPATKKWKDPWDSPKN